MKPSTRAGLVRAYGYLLEFSCRNALFNKGAMVAGHVTPEIVDAFLSELRDRVGSVTRVVYISRIRTIARILDPGHDLSWLREIELDLRYEQSLDPNITASSPPNGW
jgi:hypothetical protein